MTSERYYDYYGSRAAYAPQARYGTPRRAQMNYMDAGYAPRGAARRPYAPAERRTPPNQGRPSGGARGQNRRSAPQSRPTGSNRRPTPGSRRVNRGLPMPVKLCVASAVLIVLIVLVGIGMKLFNGVRESSIERFVDNVYINGVCLTGYTQEEGIDLIHNIRDEHLNASYTLSFQDRTWTFSPAAVNAQLDVDPLLEQAWNLGHVGDRTTRKEIVKALQDVPAQFTCEPTYDEAALDDFIHGIADAVYTAPVDAEVTLTEDKPIITQASQNGWALDQDALKATLIELIETGSGDTKLPVREVQPTVVSDNMEMDLIAKVSTDVTFRGFDSRSNVRTALNHFNLFAVYPGDTVSFNTVVGPRTEALGFKVAPEYAGSKEEMGVGGGVCQASTTLYNAMIQAGMTIIERHNHTMTVAYVEPSQDAAVNYGKKDLVFRNDTEHAIYIYTNVTKEYATVTVYGARPQYRIVLESVIESESKSDLVGYQDDMTGKIVYYTTDTPVLYKEGHGSCRSQGWLVYYDWETGAEVKRVQVSYDVYSAGINVYWRGIHNPDGTTTTATEAPSQW